MVQKIPVKVRKSLVFSIRCFRAIFVFYIRFYITGRKFQKMNQKMVRPLHGVMVCNLHRTVAISKRIRTFLARISNRVSRIRGVIFRIKKMYFLAYS